MKAFNLEDIVNKVKVVEETKVENEKGGFKGDERLLTLKKGCTYNIRLLPNIKDPDNSFVTYKEIGFVSRVTNQFVYGGRSPSDAGLGKDDLFKSTQWKHFSAAKDRGDDAESKASYKLLPQRKQVINAYLVSVDGDDAEGKEKVGKVVVLKYNAQLNKEGLPVSDIFKRIHAAVWGDKAKKIGSRAFDLSSRGRSLLIKVTEKAGYNNYSETEFEDAEDIGLSPERIQEIMDSVYDLTEFVPEVKTPDEIKQILDTHWHGVSATPDDEVDESDDDEEPVPVSRKSQKSKAKSDEKESTGDNLDDLLEEVDEIPL